MRIFSLLIILFVLLYNRGIIKMLKIKQFSDKEVVFEDENGSEFVLTCKNKTDKFDIDTIEDILDWDVRTRKEDN